MDAAASVTSLLYLAKDLIKIGKEIYEAKEGREKEIATLKRLNDLADIVTKRVQEAAQDPNIPWHSIVLVKLDPKHNEQSPLRQLERVTQEQVSELGVGKKITVKQRMFRHWKKREIADRFSEMFDCWNNISLVLDQAHWELLKESHNLQQEHINLAKSQHKDLEAQQKSQYALSAEHYNLQKEHMGISKDTDDHVLNIEDQVYALQDTISKQEKQKVERRLKKEEEALRAAIEQWLSPLEFLARQRDLMAKCFPSGKWLLESEEFVSWAKGRPWQLRCYGDTGSGKTYLSSLVIDHLKRNYETENKPVICIYLSEKERGNHTPEILYGSMVKQLLQLRRSEPVISPQLRELYANTQRDRGKANLEELKNVFEIELKTYERVYLVVDAVNECYVKSQRIFDYELSKYYAEHLSLMTTTTEPGERIRTIECSNCGKKDMKVYFNCNKCDDGEFDLCESCIGDGISCRDPSHTLSEPYSRVEVQVFAKDEEIRDYVRSIINEETPQEASEALRDKRVHPKGLGTSRLARKLVKDPKLVERIFTEVVEKSNGRFLLAQLYMDSLVAKQTLKGIRDILDNFPGSWNKFYEFRMRERILGQEDEEDRTLALKVLSFATSAPRALTLRELQHALAIRAGDRKINPDLDYDREDILRVTKGFLTIDDGDDEHAFVRFFHLTLQHYLGDTRDEWFPLAESEMATACLICLEYDAFAKRREEEDRHLDKELEGKLKENPFAGYALQFWGDHVRKVESDEKIEQLALHFLQDPDRLAAYIQAAHWIGERKLHGWDVRRYINAVHVCAWFGLSSLILKLALENYDIDVQEERNGQTPLMYACRRGQVEAVRQLLELGAKVNKTSRQGKTALLEAILAEQAEAVGLLLARKELDINAGTPSNRDRTALMTASRLNLAGIVEAILGRSDVDVNKRDSLKWTALSNAALKGSTAAAKVLLAKPEIDVNSRDIAGRTALMLVAAAGEKNDCEVIRALLKHGADPNIHDTQRGGIALSAAVERSRIDILETLLEFEATDPSCVDDDGRSVMHYASEICNPDIVQILKDKHLDVNLRDNNGSTPLHDAVQSEHIFASETVELLLELGADPSIKDNDGFTPLAYALGSGNQNIISMLKGEESNGDPVDAASVEGLPIWTQVKLGRADLVAKAIAEGKADLAETEPGTGDTALHYAVRSGQDTILRTLLQDGKMDPNVPGRFRQTPLHVAASIGLMDAVEILLQLHADLNPRDQWGSTPLSAADSNDNLDVAIALIEAGATVDKTAVNIQKIFFAAVERGNIEVVKILLDEKADPLAKNDDGLVARQIARKAGNAEMIRLVDTARSLVFQATTSEQSSITSFHSMPSPPAGFAPVCRKPEDLTGGPDNAEPESALNERWAKLGLREKIA